MPSSIWLSTWLLVLSAGTSSTGVDGDDELSVEARAKIAETPTMLGQVLNSRGQPGPAAAYYEQVLAMRQKMFPPEQHRNGHPDLVGSLNHLAGILKAQGHFAKAQPSYEQARHEAQTLPAGAVSQRPPVQLWAGFVLSGLGR